MSPEVGADATILGREFTVPCTVVEVGEIRLEPMVRVVPTGRAGHRRTFTQRKRGEWIERGEATRNGTRLILEGGA